MQPHQILNRQIIHDTISAVFSGDKNQDDYFIYDGPGAIEHTFTQNCYAIDAYDGEFYQLLSEDGVLQGFINIVPCWGILFSFGIKPEFRTGENRDAFIAIAEQLIPGDITISLYDKNTRAIRFFERYGFELEKTVILKKKRSV